MALRAVTILRMQAMSATFYAITEESGMTIAANRYWILLALVAGAVVSYGVGSIGGFGLFLVAGVVFELAAWYELFKRRRGR